MVVLPMLHADDDSKSRLLAAGCSFAGEAQHCSASHAILLQTSDHGVHGSIKGCCNCLMMSTQDMQAQHHQICLSERTEISQREQDDNCQSTDKRPNTRQFWHRMKRLRHEADTAIEYLAFWRSPRASLTCMLRSHACPVPEFQGQVDNFVLSTFPAKHDSIDATSY